MMMKVSMYVPEILEALESNITDNEDDDKELKIQVEGPEEEDDDGDEEY